MRYLVLAAGTAMALGLAACGEKPPEQPAASASAADATPENAPGIALTDAVVRLPAAPDAPGVAYFTLSQGNGAPRKLVAVHVDGVERTEMHESKTENGVSTMAPVKEVAIEAGKTIAFAPGGYHVMLFDVAGTLKAGGTTEMTITLDNGDKASVPARVEALSGAAMGAMDHKM